MAAEGAFSHLAASPRDRIAELLAQLRRPLLPAARPNADERHAGGGDGASGTVPTGSLARTPEAIRTSRHMRRSHEVLLASLDTPACDAAVAVGERLQALQQRRRELTYALEHLGEATALVGQPPSPAEDDKHESRYSAAATQVEPAAASDAGLADLAKDHGGGDAETSVDRQCETLPHARGDEAAQACGAEQPSSSLSLSLSSSVVSVREVDSDAAAKSDSFEVLVQNLLRASTGSDGLFNNLRPNLHANERHSACESQTDLTGAVAFTEQSVDNSCGRLSPQGEESSLARLMCAGPRVTGLLRPEDVRQRKDAQYYAADTLERAHERNCLGAWGRESAGTRACEGEGDDMCGKTSRQLLPPLALALAASLRRSVSGPDAVRGALPGIVERDSQAEIAAQSSNDLVSDEKPWSSVHDCLRSLTDAMSNLQSVKKHRIGEGGNMAGSQDDIVADDAENLAHPQTDQTFKKLEDVSVTGPLPEIPTIQEAGARNEDITQGSASASREGDLEPFDTMDASTLRTRSCCDSTVVTEPEEVGYNSLDVSLIAASAATSALSANTDWSPRSSYEMSSVRSVLQACCPGTEIADDVPASIVEEEEEELMHEPRDTACCKDKRKESEGHGVPRSFLGSSALMTSHIDDADDQVPDANFDSDEASSVSGDDDVLRATDSAAVESPFTLAAATDCDNDADMVAPDGDCLITGFSEAFSGANGKVLSSLVSAVRGIQTDIRLMANILLAEKAARGDRGECGEQTRITGDNCVALRELVADMKKKGSLVHELSASVVSENSGRRSPEQMTILDTLTSLVCKAQSELETICPQLQFEMGSAVANPDQVAPVAMVPYQSAMHSPLDNELTVPPFKEGRHTSLSQPASDEERDIDAEVLSLQKYYRDTIAREVCGNTIDAEQTHEQGILGLRANNLESPSEQQSEFPPSQMSESSIPSSLLQAALRDVLESSLLDVEAQINEWKELKEHMVDITAATLDGSRLCPSKMSIPSTNALALKMGEFTSTFVPFDAQPSQHELLHAANEGDVFFDDQRPTLCSTSSEQQDCDNVPKMKPAGDRYKDFADTFIQKRITLAETIRLKTKVDTTAGEGDLKVWKFDLPSAPDVDIRQEDEPQLIEEYARLNAEMEGMCRSLPGLLSAMSASGMNTHPNFDRESIQRRQAFADIVPHSSPDLLPQSTRQAPASIAHVTSTPHSVCLLQSRVAMAKRLSETPSYCSSSDRIALAQKLAGKASPPDSKLSLDSFPLLEQQQLSDDTHHTLTEATAASMSMAVNAAKFKEQCDPCMWADMQKVDRELQAKAQLLQTELQAVMQDLAVATKDLQTLSTPQLSSSLGNVDLSGSSEIDLAHQAEAHNIVSQTPAACVHEAGVNTSDLNMVDVGVGVSHLNSAADSSFVSDSPGDNSVLDSIGTQVEAAEAIYEADAIYEAAAPPCIALPCSSASLSQVPHHIRLHKASHVETGPDVGGDIPDHDQVLVQGGGKEQMSNIECDVILETLDGLSGQFGVVSSFMADMQASSSIGNQLLRETTDGLVDGVKEIHLRLVELDKGQGSLHGAGEELNCQVSQVRTHLAGLQRAAAESGRAHETPSDPGDSAGAEIPVRTYEAPHQTGEASSEALINLRQLIQELQDLTAAIKSSQSSRLLPDADCPVHRECGPDPIDSHSLDRRQLGAAVCSASAHLETSEVNEMREILSIFRLRLKASVSNDATELDLSSFPHGPQAGY